MSRSLSSDLANPNLFIENPAGQYTYHLNSVGGRSASGQLLLSCTVVRKPSTQVNAGGSFRRDMSSAQGVDDGGHLIAARFGGSPNDENLTAQDRNLNRGAYKRMENEWARHLEAGDRVFVNIETARGDRPNAYMGYAIYEHSDGTRDYDVFSYANESKLNQQKWQDEFSQYEADWFWRDKMDDYLGTAADGGIFDDMDRSERQAFAAAWDEQLVTPLRGVDDAIDWT